MAKRTERSIIAIIGRTNVGKSSLLNLLSGQKEYAIIDETPGTTADTVTCLMEIHGLGPFKILDTAGVNENTELGEKKKKKTHEAMAESNLVLLVLNTEQKDISIELELIERAKKHKKQVLIILNNFCEQKQESRKEIRNIPCLSLCANDTKYHSKLIEFIKKYFQAESRNIDLIPSLKNTGFVLLVVPMDEETPTHRLLRPQDMTIERLLRNYITPVLFRPDLSKARDPKDTSEKNKFQDLIKKLSQTPEGLQLVITDSQAFDLIADWTPEATPLTSFSVMMANYMSYGNLEFLFESAKVLDTLKKGDRILIAESCNHDRKCNDIGTVQIPKIIEEKIGAKLNFEFNFGRPFPDDLEKYKLIIHCGGCMIDRQRFALRIEKAQEAGIPFTNYGLFLAYTQKGKLLERVIKPFL